MTKQGSRLLRWAVTEAIRRQPAGSRPRAVLVGRSGQLSALDAALAEAGRGRPSAVVVDGEAGVGKSRLVEEFWRSVTRCGNAVDGS